MIAELKKLQKMKLITDNENINLHKKNHAKNSPASNYLSKIFGDEWTKDYLDLFMYEVR